jgi:hypothetical protein
MYSVCRDLSGRLCGIKHLSDGSQIPLDAMNMDYRDFLLWVSLNPSHGLDLRPQVAPGPVPDDGFDALRAKLLADQDLTREELRRVLRRLLK